MNQTLLKIGGVANGAFVLFHAWLGWQIHRWPGLAPQARVLLELLNAGGALFLLLFALTPFFCANDLLTTRLGRWVLSFVVLIYGSRAVEELVLVPRFSWAIFTTCCAMALLYLAILLRARRPYVPPIAAAPPPFPAYRQLR
jgi:hypothetical protein